MIRFVLATGNRHKAHEFGNILAPCRVDVMPAGVELPPEGVESFADNARGKAEALALAVEGDPALLAQLGLRADEEVLFLADDSGLEVEALGWAPGVTSARYAGVEGPGADRANYERLLGELRGCAGPLARRARFVCSVVAVADDMTHYAATGYWWGAVADAPRGEGGFGYDPVFIPEGSDLTVAEWPQNAKDQASHRALAGKALVDVLRREGLLDGIEGSQTG
ncbi:MAG TPA: non-canonical purine NTP pyrophosphatase [Thermoleophilia bacterium]|nr:non-canonical purine NTP pyrophosphatase [Thermoleophilia bacterium]